MGSHSSTGGAALPLNEPIAIVGIGCRFPQAPSPAALWALMMRGGDAISEVPKDRFDVDRLFDPVPGTPGKVMSRTGGFLDAVDRFDAGFFSISTREADRLDPQQRLLLEVGWEALEDAGHVRGRDESTTGVFVGLWVSDYEARLARDAQALDFFSTTGTGRYAASGRLSYVFGFDGPSITVDTAASSSLVAVHLACQSIRTGECDRALAGGANVILEPFQTIAYSRQKMMGGRCRFGDASGEGYARSEGAGVVVLKRLSTALADGDRIYAVIRGSASNNDGRTSGFLATPGREGQEQLLRRAYRAAGVSPGSVQYVEAHGTGTRAGDPVEIAALGAVLAEGRNGSKCRVGSVKTNIGHPEAAAGVAGLIKAALSLALGTVPPSLHCETPNPEIPWADLPIEVNREVSHFADGGLAVAGVSSFGMTGTNAHVVLEQFAAPPAATMPDEPHLFAMSSHSLDLLRDRLSDLSQAPFAADASLADICFTAAVRRAHQPHRFVTVAASREELHQQLQEASAQEVQAGGVINRADEAPRRVVYVFPGQGSQWVGMGRELMAHEPVFREALEECDRAVRVHTGWSVVEELLRETDSRLPEIDVVQPVLFSVQVALAALWRARGIHPDAVVGHSMGEVAAAHVAGALSLGDAARIISVRSRLMRRTSGKGAMAVVELSRQDAERALAGLEDRLSVAVTNSRKSSVIAGEPSAVAAVLETLEARGVFCRPVNIDVASHSPQMDPICGELREEVSATAPGPATVPVYSTVKAAPIEGDALDAGYWVNNLRQPVLFAATVERLLADGFVTFVEMSPHPLLVGAVQETARAAGADRVLAVASTRRGEDERRMMLSHLGQLHARGHAVAWSAIFRDPARVVSMPLYRYQRERFWYDEAPAREAREAAVTGASASGAATAQGIRDQLADAPAGRRRHQLLEQWLQAQVAGVLRTQPARVDLNRPFKTLGFDSLMGLELRNRVEQGAAVNLPATKIWNHPTVTRLTPVVAEAMGIPLDAHIEAAPAPAQKDADDLDSLILELEQLSDAEARRLVAGDQ